MTRNQFMCLYWFGVCAALGKPPVGASAAANSVLLITSILMFLLACWYGHKALHGFNEAERGQ